MLEGEWSKALNSLLFLTVRCFYVVQEQKGVADAMIKANSLPRDLVRPMTPALEAL